MTRKDRVQQLSEYLSNLSSDEVQHLAQGAQNENGWFTHESVSKSISGIAFMLSENKIDTWLDSYLISDILPKRIGLILAGNIPMVGFHDILSGYLCGHQIIVKPSHQDSFLIKHLINFLNAGFREPPIILSDRLANFDAIIATGNNNSSRYFEYYFGKYSHIIRKSRTSIGVVSGEESEQELTLLGDDIFSYFGFGCRNVSMVLVPEGYDMTTLDARWNQFSEIVNHHKYANNYDYQKSILLINREKHLDFGYLLLRPSELLHSPISQLHYMFYDNQQSVDSFIQEHRSDIQCVVGKDVPFGKAQRPELWDYADGVDTMKFLVSL